MKFFLCMLCWVVCYTLALAQQPSIIFLRTQSEVDSFPIRYGPLAVLPQSLVIGSDHDTTYSDIQDLSALSSLRLIWGSLYVYRNGILPSLHGLEQLDTVFSSLYIGGNPQLQHLQGLQGLRDVHSSLIVVDNPALQDLTGLDSLLYVASDVTIQRNNALRNLQGLGTLGQAGFIDILDNEQLENLAGLGGLRHATNMEVSGNTRLRSVEGLDRLQTVFGTITIADNDSLEYCAGFPLLYQTAGLWVERNPRLLGFSDFGSADSLQVGRLYVSDNPRLHSLQGLEHITTIIDRLYIERNDSLQSLRGLGIERIGTAYDYSRAEVYIRDNPRLTELALDSLRVIGQPGQSENSQVEIRRNRSLKTLNGLTSLDSCHARLSILENDSLQTVDLPTLRYGYNIVVEIDSVEESRVGPLANLEYVEKTMSIYGPKHIEGFSKLKWAGALSLGPSDGYIRGFNQLQYSNGIGIQGSPWVVDGFHNIHNTGNIGCAQVRDTLKAFEQVDTLALPQYARGSLGFHVYDQCYYDSAFSKLQYMKGSFTHTYYVGVPDPTHLGNHLPHFAALKKIGFRLQFYNNTLGLRIINAFPQLTHVGPPTYSANDPGGVFIYGNSFLNSLAGLEHLTKITGVIQIYDNDSLADCSALCPVLQHAVISGPVTIHDNPFPCGSKPEILAWCDTAYISAAHSPEGLAFALWPNPTTGEVQVQLPEGAVLYSMASLYDLGGRRLWQAAAGEAAPTFALPALPAGVYIFVVQSGGQRGWRRLVLLPR